tara:strand:+ start:237 stop:374 length:138 start_codon:yes stop_codon:yes gene_type:complete
VITKTKFWKLVRKELKEMERSQNLTAQVMTKIKDIPQNENKKKGS